MSELPSWRSAPPCLGCPVSELAPPPVELELLLPELLSLPPQAATTRASAATTLARSSRSVLLVMQRPFVSGSVPRGVRNVRQRQVRVVHFVVRGFNASCRPSPTRLKARTVTRS